MNLITLLCLKYSPTPKFYGSTTQKSDNIVTPIRKHVMDEYSNFGPNEDNTKH